MPDVRQSVGNVASLDNSPCRVSLPKVTLQGSTLVLVASARIPPGMSLPFLFEPSGWSGTRVLTRVEDDIAMAVWVRQNSAPVSAVTVQAFHQSLQVHVVEQTGISQNAALDKVAVASGDSTSFSTGSTGTISQADEQLLGFVASQYASTQQTGFTGGLGKLSDTVTPTTDLDGERHRLTVHTTTTSVAQSYRLSGQLTTARDWIAVLLTFRTATSGPLRMTSTNQAPILSFSGRADLSMFGPLVSTSQAPTLTFSGRGWIGPFEHQFLLGGRGGLLVGKGTPYRVESVEGLGGWDVRQSDTEFPRGDGAQRGVDLQSARQVLMSVNFDGPPVDLEAAMQALLVAVRPQRDTDWPLIFRLPGRPLQRLVCRPMSLARELTAEQLILTKQALALRASDPRIYSERERRVEIPVSAAAPASPVVVSVENAGNAPAHPLIRVQNRGSTTITRVELVNASVDSTFAVNAQIPPGGELVGDMPARVTGAPRSVVTLDGQPIYGQWQPPRQPFYLAAAPIVGGGINAVYVRTEPPSSPVAVTLDFRDTWAG